MLSRGHPAGVEITFEIHGTGDAVVLLHPFPLDRHLWHEGTSGSLAALATGSSRPDARGFGETPAIWALVHRRHPGVA